MPPNGMMSNRTQIIPEVRSTIMEKTQKARLMFSKEALSTLSNPSPSIGTASITCMHDRTKDKLAKPNSNGPSARSVYMLMDQCGIS